MSDLDHQWGSDLAIGPTGDIATVEGLTASQQRVLRRLLSNPLDYIWYPEYGAGLAQFVGQPAADPRIQAVIRGQISKEPTVSQAPEPTIVVTKGRPGSGNAMYVQVQYVDAQTGGAQLLAFPVSD